MRSEHLKLEDEAVGALQAPQRRASVRFVSGRYECDTLLCLYSDGDPFAVTKAVDDAMPHLVDTVFHDKAELVMPAPACR